MWGAILGPLQVLFIRNCSNIKKFGTFQDAPSEVQLALSILPAVEALISPLGAIYHCPLGAKVVPPDEDENTIVTNEDNFSAYAAFKALLFILNEFYTGGDPVLDYAKQASSRVLSGLLQWFWRNLVPGQFETFNVIAQGGHVTFDGRYIPSMSFDATVQTWGLLVIGAERFDQWYAGKTTAWDIWVATKKLAGYWSPNGQLQGVGFTTTGGNRTNSILSGEATWSAIFMCRRLAYDYIQMGKLDWALALENDAASMMTYIQSSVAPCDDGVWCGGGLVQKDGSFLETNKRNLMPWLRYANPIGATSPTSWAVFNDFDYNPFELGGTFYNHLPVNNSFWNMQCVNNTPVDGILQRLAQWYES
jgi:hypothetical protein